MNIEQLPFNIQLYRNDRRTLADKVPVTSTDIYDGLTGQLNNEGLFSPIIFGQPGENRRNTTFSYIDLRTKVLHPLIYKNLTRVSAFYSDIMMGRRYAKWDDKTKSFTESNELDGETGYSFFFKHWEEIVFERNTSDKRNLRLDTIDKYRKDSVYDFMLIMPAGLRDIEEDRKGNVTQDEVNDLYRSLIGMARNIDTQYPNNKFNDTSRSSIQRNMLAIFELIFSYIKGKKGFFQNKVAKRRIDNGTRSVLSAMDLSTEDLEGPQSIKSNNGVMGLYQSMKATLPLIQHAFKGEFIQTIFGGNDGRAQLVNKKTLKGEVVNIQPSDYDLWMSEEGTNKLINRFRKPKYRHKPVMVAGAYLALIYRDSRGFRIIHSIDEVPETARSKVTPLTWVELFYYLARPQLDFIPLFVTRYPVNNMDSMTPCWLYVKTTVKGAALYEYDEHFRFKTDHIIYNEFPVRGEAFIDTLIPHPNKLKDLNADHDGDTGSGDCTYSVESVAELKAYYADINNWFDSEGRLAQAFNNDILTWVCNSSTGVVKDDGVVSVRKPPKSK